MRLVVRILYLFAPLLVSAAISAPVHRFDWFSPLARPIDGGRTLRGRRVFGDGKTWRGLAIAVVGSIITVAAQKYVLLDATRTISVIDYSQANPFVLGTAFGVGAIAGELPNSFVKRRLGIARGGTAADPTLRALFWVWDQIDTVTLTWLFLLPWVLPSPALVVATLASALAIHPLIALIGFAFGARATAR